MGILVVWGGSIRKFLIVLFIMVYAASAADFTHELSESNFHLRFRNILGAEYSFPLYFCDHNNIGFGASPDQRIIFSEGNVACERDMIVLQKNNITEVLSLHKISSSHIVMEDLASGQEYSYPFFEKELNFSLHGNSYMISFWQDCIILADTTDNPEDTAALTSINGLSLTLKQDSRMFDFTDTGDNVMLEYMDRLHSNVSAYLLYCANDSLYLGENKGRPLKVREKQHVCEHETFILEKQGYSHIMELAEIKDDRTFLLRENSGSHFRTGSELNIGKEVYSLEYVNSTCLFTDDITDNEDGYPLIVDIIGSILKIIE